MQPEWRGLNSIGPRSFEWGNHSHNSGCVELLESLVGQVLFGTGQATLSRQEKRRARQSLPNLVIDFTLGLF